MKKKFLGALVVLVCIFYLSILSVVVVSLVKPALDQKTIEQLFIVPISDFSPEPQERILFFIATLSIPFVCAGVYFLLMRDILSNPKPIARKTYQLFNYLFVAIVAGMVFLGLRYAQFNYFGISSMLKAPFLTLIADMVIFVLLVQIKPWVADGSQKRKALIGFIYFFLGLILLGLVFSETVFNERDPFVSRVHFVAYFDTVVQVYLGKTLFVNFPSQYGAYASMLAPVFKFIGLNVLKFTIVMGVLKALVYFCMLLALWKVTKNKVIGFLGFATIVFYTRIRAPLDISKDPYFQYNPHRMIFPALFVLLLWFYTVENRSVWKKFIYVLIAILCSLSVLWSPDTGLVVWVAWFVYLGYEEFLSINQTKLVVILWNCIKHFLFNLGITAGGFFLFYLCTYISVGVWPDMFGSAEYTKLFYYYGFYMIPMPKIHPWHIVVLFYIVGLFIPISYLIDVSGYLGTVQQKSHNQPLIQFIFGLSILGIGLFNYYVGRSHDYNLIPTIWPMAMLAVIFADQLFEELSPIIYNSTLGIKAKLSMAFQKDFDAYFFLGLFYVLSSTVLSIGMAMPGYVNLISERWTGVFAGRPRLVNTEVDFIHSTSSHGDDVLILSDLAPLLYLYTNNTRPVDVAGFGEIMLKQDINRISEFLAAPPQGAKIYWDPNFKLINPSNFTNLHLAGYTKNNKFILFEDSTQDDGPSK